MPTLQENLNAGNPDTLPTGCKLVQFGSVLRGLPTTLANEDPVAAPGEHAATLERIAKSDLAPALTVSLVYGRVGGVTSGPLTAAAYPPITGQYSIAPNGDIVVLAADAWTKVDAVFLPYKCDLIEYTGQVVPGTGVMSIPQYIVDRGVAVLVRANALAGTVTGLKIVQAPAAAAPATTKAGLNLAKSSLFFAVADAVTSATVLLAVFPAVDLDSLLSAPSPLILPSDPYR